MAFSTYDFLPHVVRFYWARIPQRHRDTAAHFSYVFNMLSTFLCILQHYQMCQSAAVMPCPFSRISLPVFASDNVCECMRAAFTLTGNAVRQVTNVHINGCVKSVAES